MAEYQYLYVKGDKIICAGCAATVAQPRFTTNAYMLHEDDCPEVVRMATRHVVRAVAENEMRHFGETTTP